MQVQVQVQMRGEGRGFPIAAYYFPPYLLRRKGQPGTQVPPPNQPIIVTGIPYKLPRLPPNK